MKISKVHPFNGNINTLDLNTTLLEFDNYRAGMCSQAAFPNLTPDEREFIITGILPGEWDSYFNSLGGNIYP